MQTRNTIISIVIGLVVIIGAFLAVFGSSLKNLKNTETAVPAVAETGSSTKPAQAATSASSTAPAAASGYTLTQVSSHNSATSCWSAVNGQVYDLTSWVNAHPGGKAAILMICGKDGSPLFNAQHGNSGKIAKILAKYEIGVLN